MRGISVTVHRPETALDEAMEESTVWHPERVENVLAAPAGTDALGGSDRPHGVKADIRFAFPKGYAGDLRGCRIECMGRVYSVVGDPVPALPELCPTDWNMTVEGVRADG